MSTNATHTPGPRTLPMTFTPEAAARLMVQVASSGKPDNMEAVAKDIEAIIRQRDDLLAACEAASGFVEAHALALGDAGKVGASQAALVAYDQLRSAIAAARGGKGGE